MKSFMPWFLVALTGSQAVYAIDGLDAYRQGNYSLAAQALVNQAGKEDPLANYYLGRMRLYGYGQLKNNSLAMRYFTQAAEKGVLPAQQLLARYYLFAEKDPEKALTWFKRAANGGDTQAKMYCAAAYLFGFGTKKNPGQAQPYYLEAAKKGDPIGQYALGEEFISSRNLQSKKLGTIWLNKSAAQGNPRAQVKLAEIYLAGGPVNKDPNKARLLAEQAANQGYIPALTVLGELELKQGHFEAAKDYFTKAAEGGEVAAEIALAKLYNNPNTAFHSPQSAFLWMSKAANHGLSEAQIALSIMYKEGKGVPADANLAQQWQQKAKLAAGNGAQLAPSVQAARWLSNGKNDNFIAENYRLGGIYNAWQNPFALKENNYNQAPQMEAVLRSELYKPNFVMVKPTEVTISDYFDLIAPSLSTKQHNTWTFPRYPLDKQIEALQRNESLVLRHPERVSMSNEGVPYPARMALKPFDYLGEMTANWQHLANYQAVLSQLYGQAILGDSDAQFELGQLYQYGIAVAKSPEQALSYYQLAAMQQDVRAEYNLGILYLEGKTNPIDYQEGISWLADAAFKGNRYAQYVLAYIYEKGLSDSSGKVIVQPDVQQAMAMYYLASANNYAPAEYRLADYLAKQGKTGLSVVAQQNRTQLIKRLYQEAATQGIAEASLPLAFYNAMDADPTKQAQAYAVAKYEAEAGNKNAAILMGLMTERGITVEPKESEALSWYQKAPMNPVTAFILGTYYSQGNGLRKDLEKGAALLQQAADAGFSYANLNLAVLKAGDGANFLPDLDKARQLGNSIAGLLLADYYLAQANNPNNMQQAREIYQYFAEKGDRDAQLKLAYLYDKGLGGQVDRELAGKWYNLAAEQGQPVAQYLLGRLYQLGRIGKQPNYEEAKKLYAAAKTTYPRAAVALGFIYDTVDDDYLKAFANYQWAAEKGDAVGQYNLALIYENGKGQKVDYEKAKKLYIQAANLGYVKAMSHLADFYLLGLAGGRDEKQALDWYKKAASLGDSEALYQLGLLSETGVATALNLANAVNYYQQAAAKDNEKAKLALARMYQYGLGTSKDTNQAAQLYNELAKINNAYAQYQLALMYMEGLNGERKLDEGKRFLKLASDNGNQQATKMLQWMDAQQQDRVSFIEPVVIIKAPMLAGQTADLMYLDAISEWNRGDEALSRMILDRLMHQFPQYAPAKRAYEQLNQQTTLLSSAI